MSPLLFIVALTFYFVHPEVKNSDDHRGDVYVSVSSVSSRVEALATVGGRSSGVLVEGIDISSAENLVFDRPDLKQQVLADFGQGQSILIARQTADALQASDGDVVTIMLPADERTPMGMVPKIKRFRVAALVEQAERGAAKPFVYLEQSEARKLFDPDQPAK